MENKEKSVGINFIDGLTNIKKGAVNDAPVRKKNITNGRIIHR